jgi:hypothetical protein
MRAGARPIGCWIGRHEESCDRAYSKRSSVFTSEPLPLSPSETRYWPTPAPAVVLPFSERAFRQRRRYIANSDESGITVNNFMIGPRQNQRFRSFTSDTSPDLAAPTEEPDMDRGGGGSQKRYQPSG